MATNFIHRKLILTVLESNRLEIEKKNKQTKEMLRILLSDLKKEFPLPKNVKVDDEHHEHHDNYSLDKKIYSLIKFWLINKRMSYVRHQDMFIIDGFFGFDTKELRDKWLPKINEVLSVVGLIGFPDFQGPFVFVQPIDFNKK